MTSDRAWTYVLDEPVSLLVVDDDPILREFAKVHLATPTARVEAAADGEEAWDMLQAGGYDLVLLDIEMPGLDGFALLERIRGDARFAELACVMLTGHEDVASIDRAFALGSSFFVTKPVNWRLLSYQLRHVLRSGKPAAAAPPGNSAVAAHVSRMMGMAAQLLAQTRDEAAAERLQRLVAEGRAALRLLGQTET